MYTTRNHASVLGTTGARCSINLAVLTLYQPHYVYQSSSFFSFFNKRFLTGLFDSLKSPPSSFHPSISHRFIPGPTIYHISHQVYSTYIVAYSPVNRLTTTTEHSSIIRQALIQQSRPHSIPAPGFLVPGKAFATLSGTHLAHCMLAVK
jgi:hypothetical protein